jgi:imidazolonepropionase-like amidohydrolase
MKFNSRLNVANLSGVLSTMRIAPIIVLLAAAACRSSDAQSPVQAFTHATLIDGTGAAPRSDVTIIVREGRILALQSSTQAMPPGATVVDLSGKFVTPGLIDAHVHLGTQPRPPGMMEAVLRAVFMGGVTAVRDMGGRLDILREMSLKGNTDSVPMPRVRYSAIMAGPGMWFDSDRGRFAAGEREMGTSPVVRRVDASSDIAAVIRDAKNAGASGIKLYNTLDSATVHALAREAKRQGLEVWSHSYVDRELPSSVIDAGATVVSHADGYIYEAMTRRERELPRDSARAARHRAFERASAGDSAISALVESMRRRNVILDATLLVMRPGPDSTGRFDSAHAALFRGAVRFARAAHRAGVDIAAGTDGIGGSSPNLHVELQLLVDSVGMTPLQAIRSATQVNARALGAADSLGTLEVGKLADFVVYDADPSLDIANTLTVTAVAKAGRLVRRQKAMPTPPTARTPKALRQ